MIMQGLGCKVLAYDPFKNKAIEAAGIPYMSLDEIYAQADVMSIHVPLLPQTTKMIDAEAISKFKKGAVLRELHPPSNPQPHRHPGGGLTPCVWRRWQ